VWRKRVRALKLLCVESYSVRSGAGGGRRQAPPAPQTPVPRARSASGEAIERAHTHTEIMYLNYYYAGCSSKVLSK
jgi:hypothetical protein